METLELKYNFRLPPADRCAIDSFQQVRSAGVRSAGDQSTGSGSAGRRFRRSHRQRAGHAGLASSRAQTAFQHRPVSANQVAVAQVAIINSGSTLKSAPTAIEAILWHLIELAIEAKRTLQKLTK